MCGVHGYPHANAIRCDTMRCDAQTAEKSQGMFADVESSESSESESETEDEEDVPYAVTVV